MWIELKICREDVDNVKKFSLLGVKEDCFSCNFGMQVNSIGVCDLCLVDFFSDGKVGMIL